MAEVDAAGVDYSDEPKVTYNISVGSHLTDHDWNQIDNKDTVASARRSGSYVVLQNIQRQKVAAKEKPAVSRDAVVGEYLALLSSLPGPTGNAQADFVALTKRWFPDAPDCKKKKKASSEKRRGEILSDLRATDAYSAAWLACLSDLSSEATLLLRRVAAASALPDDGLEADAARAHWAAMSEEERQRTMVTMHCSGGKKGAVHGPPVVYDHQEELLGVLEKHLMRARKVGANAPLNQHTSMHVVYSTPTGSGKTFTALLIRREILPRFRNQILVYSVPTKQVLTRVGVEFEAMNAVYWTMSCVRENLYEVRRPYSIRSGRDHGGSLSSGNVLDLLAFNVDKGVNCKDRGQGKPDVIIADIDATRALLHAIGPEGHMEDHARYDVLKRFSPVNMMMFLDEPNMGIHLNKVMYRTMRTIMASLPLTAILASATLPDWENLPRWWRGTDPERSVERSTVTRVPLDLPSCRLSRLHLNLPEHQERVVIMEGEAAVGAGGDSSAAAASGEGGEGGSPVDENRESGSVRGTSVLDLFEGNKSLRGLLTGGDAERMCALVSRHLTPEQGNALIGVAGPDFERVVPSVFKLRRDVVVPALRELPDERFETLKQLWSDKKPREVTQMRDVASKTGITLVATIKPEKVARMLMGVTPEQYNDRKHTLMKRVKEVQKQKKERERTLKDAKRKTLEEMAREGQLDVLTVQLGRLKISLDEAEQLEPHSLVLLSLGIVVAYEQADPMMLAQFQRAVLDVGEGRLSNERPPLHILVVDYSSVYGMDCPAVDTLVLCSDLGDVMSTDDLQQFLGRLRRDGSAIFTSFEHLATAIRAPAEPWSDAFDNAVSTVAEAAGKGDKAASLASLVERAALVGSYLPTPRGEVLGKLLRDAIEGAGAKPAEVEKLLEVWGEVIELSKTTKADQVAMLVLLEQLLGSSEAMAKCTGNLLVTLYNEDVFHEQALTAWSRRPALDAKLVKRSSPMHIVANHVTKFIDWMQTASDDDEDSD